MHIRPYRAADEVAVVELWESSGLTRPWNDPHKDIGRKLAVRPEWFLVGEDNGVIVATAMVGYDGHRGWVYYLGVAPGHRRLGYGRAMMAEAERLLRAEGCPKLNLQVRTGNAEAVAFYENLGFGLDAVIGMGKRLEHDS
jgi:ribosomal protein S18 acetylase RimI-like enzyme